MRSLWVGLALGSLLGCTFTPIEARDSSRFPKSDPERDVPIEEVPVAGQHAEVRYRDGDGESGAREGELLAIDGASVYLLIDGRTVIVERARLEEASVEIHDAEGTVMVAWTLLGTLSTASHGFLLIVSAPVWMLGGLMSGLSAGVENDAVASNDVLDALRSRARFPAGLPDTWDLAARHPDPREPAAGGAPAQGRTKGIRTQP